VSTKQVNTGRLDGNLKGEQIMPDATNLRETPISHRVIILKYNLRSGTARLGCGVALTDDVRFRQEIENSRADIDELLLRVRAMVLKGNVRVMPIERARLRILMKDFSATTIEDAIVAKKLIGANLRPT
jgi:hypothetical protein